MLLYHYRSIENAILEIEKGTFHFAPRKDLNDPLEGYIHVYWQGDKAAWEGLFRNYLCSLFNALEMYLLAADKDLLYYRTLMPDIHKFDDVPIGKLYKNIGDVFLADTAVQALAGLYGKNRTKVQYDELRLILQFVHSKALNLCIETCVQHRIIPEEEGAKVLGRIKAEKHSGLLEKIYDSLSDANKEVQAVKYFKEVFEDAVERQFVESGFEDEFFLYRNNDDKDITEESRQHRNWLAVAVDFPKIYIEQMKESIYPEGFIVCFSGKNDDSAMWGNYADNHCGVCLIYETDKNQEIRIKMPEGFRSRKVKPVEYGGELLERNFFESFGRLTISQIRSWLTGSEGISDCYKVFSDADKWREEYWNAFETKNYRKLKEWEHEDEYRIAIDNLFGEYEDPESRNLQYDPRTLRGIIFGINTSEFEKKKIMEKLIAKKDVLEKFSFFQAEYDDIAQKIVIRPKRFWKL